MTNVAPYMKRSMSDRVFSKSKSASSLPVSTSTPSPYSYQTRTTSEYKLTYHKNTADNQSYDYEYDDQMEGGHEDFDGEYAVPPSPPHSYHDKPTKSNHLKQPYIEHSEDLPVEPHGFRYILKKPLGKGAFAVTYMAEQVPMGSHAPSPQKTLVAVKKLKKTYAEIGMQENEFLKQTFSTLSNSQYIVHPIDFFTDNLSVNVVYELLDSSRHLQITSTTAKGKLKELAKLAVQLFMALHQLHSIGWAHCDVKPENVMYKLPNSFISKSHSPSITLNQPVISDGAGIKLIDFSNTVRVDNFPIYYDDFNLQTIAYRAPEIFAGDSSFTPKIDVWSAGIVLLEAFIYSLGLSELPQNWKLLASENEEETIFKIIKFFGGFDCYAGRGSIYDSDVERFAVDEEDKTPKFTLLNQVFVPENFDIEDEGEYLLAKDFFMYILEPDHSLRASSQDALRHPFLVKELLGDWGDIILNPPVDKYSLGSIFSSNQSVADSELTKVETYLSDGDDNEQWEFKDKVKEKENEKENEKEKEKHTKITNKIKRIHHNNGDNEKVEFNLNENDQEEEVLPIISDSDEDMPQSHMFTINDEDDEDDEDELHITQNKKNGNASPLNNLFKINSSTENLFQDSIDNKDTSITNIVDKEALNKVDTDNYNSNILESGKEKKNDATSHEATNNSNVVKVTEQAKKPADLSKTDFKSKEVLKDDALSLVIAHENYNIIDHVSDADNKHASTPALKDSKPPSLNTMTSSPPPDCSIDDTTAAVTANANTLKRSGTRHDGNDSKIIKKRFPGFGRNSSLISLDANDELTNLVADLTSDSGENTSNSNISLGNGVGVGSRIGIGMIKTPPRLKLEPFLSNPDDNHLKHKDDKNYNFNVDENE